MDAVMVVVKSVDCVSYKYCDVCVITFVVVKVS